VRFEEVKNEGSKKVGEIRFLRTGTPRVSIMWEEGVDVVKAVVCLEGRAV
jgi:hypothetical protein